jgi:hypothetical protein
MYQSRAAQSSRQGTSTSTTQAVPGKRTLTSQLEPVPPARTASASVPPQVLARAGDVFDHFSYQYRITSTGGFTMLRSPDGKGIGLTFAHDNERAAAWKVLADHIVDEAARAAPPAAPATAPAPEAPAPSTEAPSDEGWSLGGVVGAIGDGLAAVGDAITGAITGAVDGGLGIIEDAIDAVTGGEPAIAPGTPGEATPVETAPVAPPAAGVNLTAEQVGAAIAFYRDNARAYPPGVINAIATELGLRSAAPTDHASSDAVADAAFVDAVAGYQLDKKQEANGIAGEPTMKSMFGRSITCRTDAVDQSKVTGADGTARVASGVTLTADIKAAWALLEPHLPATAYMSSGVRTWDKTVEILLDYIKSKAPKMIELGLTTQAEIDKAIADQDYAKLHKLGNQDYDTNGDGKIENFAIAAPGSSDHITGLAFDIASTDPDRETRASHVPLHDAAVKKVVAEVPAFAAVFEKTIPETGNRCVHVDLKKPATD